VVEPGSEPDGLYVVVTGCFELTSPAASADGATPRTRRLGPGDCFGVSVEGKAPTEPERVRACEDSTACFIERGDLQRLAVVAALIGKRGQATEGKQLESG
jgi:CRP-like cAMP-binding protein